MPSNFAPTPAGSLNAKGGMRFAFPPYDPTVPYFPLTLTLSPIGGEGTERDPLL